MKNSKYQNRALKTDDPTYEDQMQRMANKKSARLIHAQMGLSGEVGEITEAIKKHIFYGKPLDVKNIKEECGDVLWYMAILLDEIGTNFSEVMFKNIMKLEERYSNGFDKNEAINRIDVTNKEQEDDHFRYKEHHIQQFYDEYVMLKLYEPIKPCKKQVVKALIKVGKQRIFGSNSIKAKIDTCPREVMKCSSGEGYELCRDVCGQRYHAEVDAIKLAKKQDVDISGGDLFLMGHTYCCENCLSSCREAGLKNIYVLDFDGIVIKHYEL